MRVAAVAHDSAPRSNPGSAGSRAATRSASGAESSLSLPPALPTQPSRSSRPRPRRAATAASRSRPDRRHDERSRHAWRPAGPPLRRETHNGLRASVPRDWMPRDRGHRSARPRARRPASNITRARKSRRDRIPRRADDDSDGRPRGDSRSAARACAARAATRPSRDRPRARAGSTHLLPVWPSRARSSARAILPTRSDLTAEFIVHESTERGPRVEPKQYDGLSRAAIGAPSRVERERRAISDASGRAG